jgi:hypothetical protein
MVSLQYILIFHEKTLVATFKLNLLQNFQMYNMSSLQASNLKRI